MTIVSTLTQIDIQGILGDGRLLQELQILCLTKLGDPFALKRDAIKILFVASHFRPVIIFTIASEVHSATFHGF